MFEISVYIDTILKSSDCLILNHFQIDCLIYFLLSYNKDIQDDQRYYSILYIRICKRRCP